jgi:hypothetical protein
MILVCILASVLLLYMTKQSSKAKTAFYIGWMFAVASDSMFQDMLGKDEYIRHVAERWQDSTWSVMISSAIFFFGAVVLTRQGERDAE